MHTNIRWWASMAVVALGAASGPLAAHAQPSPESAGSLRVMTYNAGEGTDYMLLFRATDPPAYQVGLARTLQDVQATRPLARMRALAAQIATAAPAVVSLQEINRWWVGPFNLSTGRCDPVRPLFDMLPALRNALQARGLGYDVAVQTPQFTNLPDAMPAEFGPNDFRCVQVLNRNLILVRNDLAPGVLRWSNPRAGRLGVPPEAAGAVSSGQGPELRYFWPTSRSWVSVDVQYRGRWLRFFGAHLSNLGEQRPGDLAEPRRQDAAELRALADASPLPVAIAMDSAAQAAPAPPEEAYADFLAAGYRDAWTEIHPARPGYTCCQAATLDNRWSQLSRRTDLVLLRGAVRAEGALRVGAQPSSRTPGGLWPSDHAGVAVRLSIGTAP